MTECIQTAINKQIILKIWQLTGNKLARITIYHRDKDGEIQLGQVHHSTQSMIATTVNHLNLAFLECENFAVFNSTFSNGVLCMVKFYVTSAM